MSAIEPDKPRVVNAVISAGVDLRDPDGNLLLVHPPYISVDFDDGSSARLLALDRQRDLEELVGLTRAQLVAQGDLNADPLVIEAGIFEGYYEYITDDIDLSVPPSMWVEFDDGSHLDFYEFNREDDPHALLGLTRDQLIAKLSLRAER